MKDGSFRNWFVHVPRGPAHPGPKLPIILSYQEAGNCPWALRNQGSSCFSESNATLTAPGHQMHSDHQLWETHLKLKNAGEIIRHLNECCSFLQTKAESCSCYSNLKVPFDGSNKERKWLQVCSSKLIKSVVVLSPAAWIRGKKALV